MQYLKFISALSTMPPALRAKPPPRNADDPGPTAPQPSTPIMSSMCVFGRWASSEAALRDLAKDFRSAEPFPHVVIENFLSDELAREIVDAFPLPHTSSTAGPSWFIYNNPIECKFTSTDLERSPPSIQKYFAAVQSDDFLEVVRGISGIPNLEQDPHIHGAGIHFHPTGGKLDMHLDYSIHPISGKERRLNLILYMNDEDWEKEWGGHLFLGDSRPDGSLKSLVKSVSPRFNSAVLFRTSDISWHGLPLPHFMSCRPGAPIASHLLCL
mmetsp:Transcript_24429/g.78499  ORF Transcript_24429/g.78499 Transcript_24429/m.78499 type:complete len:269 (+) Transcript_24429:169-975(+)